MKYYIVPFIVFLILFFQNTHAESGNGTIKGYVENPDNEPAAYSTAVLMNRDSVFMNGALISEDGTFSFDTLEKGDYYIMVRSVEFNTYVSDLLTIKGNETMDLDSIRLSAKTNDLNEVVIKGEKAMVEIHPDKMVYNVSASVNSTGNNALELLAKSPGVRIDLDNNIILQGKSGVKVYINGRPSRISGSDLSNMLEGMQSDNIESIEIITNPSAKYEAEGTGGIINIVMKKDLSNGFNGTLYGSHSRGVKPRSNLGTSINSNGKKLNIFSNINFSDNNYTFNLDEVRFQNDYSFDMQSFEPTHRKGISFNGGMDYKINKEHTLSLDTRVMINDRSIATTSNTLIKNLSGMEAAETLQAETNTDGTTNNINANLHYSFVPNKSSEFTADVSYGIYSANQATDQPNWYYDMTHNLLRNSESQYNTYTGIDLFSSQMDYHTSLGKTTLSTGVKYSYISTNNTLEYFDIENSLPVPNTDRSNDFTYLEKIAAAYAILNIKPTDKIAANAGVRVENTSSLGQLISANPGPDDVVPRNYTSLFPNISLSYDDKKNHAISLSYGRRITRPNYHDLNPFESRSSEISAWKGNPFLKPNYISNYQVSYAFKRKLVISNTYSITKNFFAYIFQTTGEQSSILTPQNMDKAIVNGLSVSYPLKVTKWWEFSTFFIYNYEAYSGDIVGTLIDLDAHILNFRMQNNFKLPKGIQMELTGFASSSNIWRGSIRIEKYNRINLGIKKSVWKNKLLLQISARDLFDTGSNYHYTSDYGGMDIDGYAFFDGRRISFNISYKFGNQNLKARKSNSSLEKELNRISD
ncbi:TonB-dependent receptor domain-containing protein [Saccharicrinis sp. FJH62]|uniref:TonB-dependent receptor domain-containing protein n=1 Tax=Saccharicrinis sp. FJH62 TaxID=3344657 RepID=UPI0035D4AA59